MFRLSPGIFDIARLRGTRQNRWQSKSGDLRSLENKKAGLSAQTGLIKLIPAVTYVPTQLPVQYHRPGEA
jgi:hypothetical protein